MSQFVLHYPEHGKFEESAYYYWYRYMQLVENYGRRHPLWEDFGDVKMPFWDWWCAHGEDIFLTGEKDGIMELNSDEEISKARAESAFIVRIDPDCPRDYLMYAFKLFLDENGILPRAGRKFHKDEVRLTKYPFFSRPDVNALKNSLNVFEARQREPRPTLYQIGCELGLRPDYVIVENEDTSEIREQKRNRMNATVSRYYRWANNIKKNVAKGIFPKHGDDASAK